MASGGAPDRAHPEDEWEDEESEDESVGECSSVSTHSSSQGHMRSRRRGLHARRRSDARTSASSDAASVTSSPTTPRKRSRSANVPLQVDTAVPARIHKRHASISGRPVEGDDLLTPTAAAPKASAASAASAASTTQAAPSPPIRPTPVPAAPPHAPPARTPAVTERVSHAMYAVLVVLGVKPPPNFDEKHMQPPPRPRRPERETTAMVASLWDHLCDEVLVNSSDGAHEMKWERVANFMAIPLWIEKTVCFGFLICLNSLLYMFTILPMRFVLAWWTWALNTFLWLTNGEKRYLTVSHKCDMLKGLLVIQTCYILSRVADASKMYHSVRGQDVVKLSVIFSVLEIADRLCCSFGQDVLDALLSRSTLARRPNGTQPYRRMVFYYAVSLAYMMFHTLVLLYQLVTLNVAINSYDNALLTLLLSNQFVEIKTTVFKRFEKDNLFQLTCADIVERFQLTMVLTAIGARNLIEVAGSQTMSGTSTLGPLPTSFEVYPYVNVLARTLNPVLTVLMSEMLVDWLKHAFITKLNHIRPAIYGRYIDVLCRDLLSTHAAKMDGDYRRQSSFVDQSPMVTRRLGLAVLPLTCILIRLGFQIAEMISQSRAANEFAFQPPSAQSLAQGARDAMHGSPSALLHGLERTLVHSAWLLVILILWVLLVVAKILLGLNLVHFATARYATRHEREAEEARNARGRPPIGETPHEAAQAQVRPIVDQPADNASSVGLYGQQPPPSKAAKETSLLDVNRYTLAGSRLW